MSEENKDGKYFYGHEWLSTLTEEIQAEWEKACVEDPDMIDKQKILFEPFSHLNWFIWASFTMRKTSQGLEYWERIIRENQLTSYQTLHRNYKLKTIGI